VNISRRQFEYFNDPHTTDEWICYKCKEKSTFKTTNVSWGDLDTEEKVDNVLQKVYSEIVTWSKNLFLLPRGKVGKDFIHELTRLINLFVYRSDSNWHLYALRLVHVFMPLMLQKPSRRSKAKINSKYLAERLEMWSKGDILGLMDQARLLQKKHQKVLEQSKAAKQKLFVQYMMVGKLAQAARLIDNDSDVSGVHEVTENIIRTLQVKHPNPIDPNIRNTPPTPSVQSVIFEEIDGEMICNAAKKTFGAAGPSQVDADSWRHMLCCRAYGKTAEALATAISEMAKILCTEQVNSSCLTELLSCRLIPLKKDVDGVRPIGVGEVLRRIMGKAVVWVLKEEIMEACGTLQTFSGVQSGIEAATHAMASKFENEESEAVLLVDAKNAFNSMNRKNALRTVSKVCPEFYQYLHNTYQVPTRQYISGSKEGQLIMSKEGSAQGDTAAMPMFGINTRPIIESLHETTDAVQIWYVDDGCAGGKLEEVLSWWNHLCAIGGEYGYEPTARKTWLIVKDPSNLPKAQKLFNPMNDSNGVQITVKGNRHLGAVLGTTEFREEYVSNKVSKWVEDVKNLALIAKSEPQNAYAVFTKAIAHRWT
jgi:hypothetical protein